MILKSHKQRPCVRLEKLLIKVRLFFRMNFLDNQGHKVLYKLKKEKQDLDQSLERLEMVSNFGETHLNVQFQHTNIIRDLNIKANPKHNSPKKPKRKTLRKVLEPQQSL